MDIAGHIHRKSTFIEQQKAGPLIRQLQGILQKRLMEDCDIRTCSPALIRALIFDLSYLMLRHRPWHLAPLLADLTIDFLNSEYALPHETCVVIVESLFDLLHHYVAPETEWSAERYDEEFLEHLLVSALRASDEAELCLDLGFGRNVLELLQAALSMGASQPEEDAFQFAPEVIGRLHKIMEQLYERAEADPLALEIYKLKNILQRDPLTRKNSLSPELLGRLMTLLGSCGHSGKSLAGLEQSLGAPVILSDIALLQRTGLIFEEAQRRTQPPLYRLSRDAYAITSHGFAAAALASPGNSPQLNGLPPAYQAALLQLLGQRDPSQLSSLLSAEAGALSPEALKIVIEAWKKNRLEQSLLELFENLLHNRAHAWIRAEICSALPLRILHKETQILLDSLAENDPSPMVRSAARLALKRQQKVIPAGEPCPPV